MVIRFTLFISFYLIFFSAFGQPLKNSALSSGNIYKVAVTSDGIHKIDADLLNALGIDASATEPDKIQILGYGGGMLPQLNSADRYEDLIENPVKVVGGGDGSFSNNDYVLFFAKGSDKTFYSTEEERWIYEKNLYADTAYYFIKIDETDSRKIIDTSLSSNDAIEISYFDEVIHHEIDEINHLNQSSSRGGSGSGSGRRWFGEKFDFNLAYSFSFPLEGTVSDKPLKITTELMSSSPVGGIFNIETNQNINQTVNIPSVPESTYGIKGRIAKESLSVVLQNTSLFEVEFKYDKRSSSSKDAGYLDYFTIEYQKENALYGNQTIAKVSEAVNHQTIKFLMKDLPNDAEIWDITELDEVNRQIINQNGANAFFIAEAGEAKEFVIFTGSDFTSPLPIGKVENQNIHSINSVNLLIITPETLKTEAERLAEFRESSDGLSSNVVTTQEIYNEFASGRQDITAIRDFIRHIFIQGSGTDSLKYVLLFGDGSYDFKDRTPENVNSSLIPIYESYESLHPIYSYSSDDYFSFMDEEEGIWSEGFNDESHLMDLAIGRLPINTLSEAKAIVDKLIRYATANEALGNWRKRIVFVADDGDANTHQLQADRLGRFIETNYEQFNTNRIFVDAFPQVVSTNTGKRFSPAARAEIEKNIENGVLIMNFTGHGAETGWTSEDILTNGQIVNWKNQYKMPMFLTATCEFGRYDNPTLKSGAELAMLNANGGAIALLTTTRPVFSNTNLEVNEAFYNAAFQEINGEMPRLGDILVKTKNNSITGVINRNFALLGDPSMRLAYPEDDIVITAVKDRNGSVIDTIKSLDNIQLEGEVRQRDFIASDFNGTVEITVFDKTTTITTLGDEGPNTIMDFEDRLSIIYRGSATVKNGRFNAEFVVPKNIDYTFDIGKISLYASHESLLRDASGTVDDLIIGGSSSNFIPENEPPQLSVYLDNENFNSGDFVSENTILYADISDDSGINITGNGIGQTITAILDEEITFNLNDFYTGTIDDFRKGQVVFGLKDLTPGSHKLVMKVWDNQNNLAEQEILFRVDNGSQDQMGKIIAAPNPFSGEVNISCFNTFPGENIDVATYIYDTSGRLINEYSKNIANSTSNINIADWNGYGSNGNYVEKGLYLVKVYLYFPNLNQSFEETLKILKK